MSRSRCYDQVLCAEASSDPLHLGHIVLRGSLHGHEVDTGVLNLEFSLFQQVLFLRFGFGSGSGFLGCRAGFPTDSHIGLGFVLSELTLSFWLEFWISAKRASSRFVSGLDAKKGRKSSGFLCCTFALCEPCGEFGFLCCGLGSTRAF